MIKIYTTNWCPSCVAAKRLLQEELIQFQEIVTFSTEKMKQVDSKGHYKSDDETGFFFDELKKLQLTLDGVFEGYRKLEELKKDQLENYINKAEIDDKKRTEEEVRAQQEQHDIAHKGKVRGY